MIKKLFILLCILCAMATGAFFYMTSEVDAYLDQPLSLRSEQIFTVQSGSSFNGVLNQFVNQQWIEESPFTPLVRRFYPELTQIRAGTFQLLPEKSLRQTLVFLTEGKEHQFSITFVEGTRFDEWRTTLAEDKNLEQTIVDLSEEDIAALIGSEHQKLEGLMLAETYNYTLGTTDLDILKRAYRKLGQVLDEEWQLKQSGLPLESPYEALILASIIEKETAVASERERVSAVFINRLNKRMRLQTDPTVIYGMGDSYKGVIGKKGLRTPTPYNTYTIFGLPPTPIAMAGRASIKAALNPEDSNYLYFVASGKGGHVFSKNLKDHNTAVRAYLKEIRSQK
ncbi:endolytic transglycosylase MltG [Vibrio genomosp. F10]|uniref:Endolytic murein transglycosylase n=1 Tax=Vibrio genomosp. F10 str. ZF-129 TaxID=1187848 RepID=A0A1E5BI52_9VIBR|nr:endolytic transglycosylase MltG [Vibrio genomosp. F10]OEE36987.1 ABC transporter substrate-binding protein [Vibrio genomosp. F10 str. ZF-129]OEE94976.1 ABC transporter substrate-binding protein [Vibrio genomosp. F10 str. 9ZC157]OEF04035.1 ABC transporter substrate-binding protein [Vibrio genomosp. F10 str. 9ZB36]